MSASTVWGASRLRTAILAGFLLLDFVLVVVMLFTDMNLQTDFGTVPKYFVHWYALLAQGILTLLVALAVLWAGLRTGGSARLGRAIGLGAAGFAFLVFLADVAIVFTYSLLGFPFTLTQFADYLYGITYSGGDIRYLYDVVLAAYLVTAIVGVWASRRVVAPPPPA